MGSCIHFHGHTYLTIAQAGLQEAYLAHDAGEYQRCSLSWKAFLDLSLTSMSSNYRRSIISGVLLLGFEYADCEQTRTMAIDYFEKVIINSQRYVSNNRDDRLIVLQCQNQVSRLYTKRQHYEYAIDHSLDALKICTENDLTDIAECYESMAQTYEHRLSNEATDLTPDDISRMIAFDNPFSSISNDTRAPSGLVMMFERSEFAFGQLSTNIINPLVLQGTDRKRQLAYCFLKIAALAQMQGYKEEEQAKIDDDDLLRKQARKHDVKARQLLHKVIKLLPDNSSVQKICANNLAYLDGNFDSIIDCYTRDLEIAQQQKDSSCVGEDAFCYIAHLHARKKNIDEEHRWYELGVKYFLSRGHICDHTTFCFSKLAHFYEKYNNFTSAINGYENLVSYLLEHNSPSFLRSSINPIVMRLVQQYK
jgi:tetratricopeptide (TPR) repeat protein